MELKIYKSILHLCGQSGVSLVAVSKTKPNEAILELYHVGQRIFGENRVSELVEKHESLPSDIAWQMIGNLQKNKVKYIAPFIAMIHSGSSLSLLKEIDKQAKKCNRSIPVLLQVKIAKEDSKFGWEEIDLLHAIQNDDLIALDNIIFKGVMGMATFTDDQLLVRNEFKSLKNSFEKIKLKIHDPSVFTEISMGMSGDYTIAIEEGSTIVRIGSLLFGER